jgi:hypothetical protein
MLMNKFHRFLFVALLWPMLSNRILVLSAAQLGIEDNYIRPATFMNKEWLPMQKYTLIMVANGPAGDGTELSISVYVTPEGTHVNTVHGRFKSKAAAKAELERQLKQDDRIVERAARKNPLGKVVGERVIVRFAATQARPDYSAVLLTDGRDYYEVTSSSMELVIDMAKRY